MKIGRWEIELDHRDTEPDEIGRPWLEFGPVWEESPYRVVGACLWVGNRAINVMRFPKDCICRPKGDLAACMDAECPACGDDWITEPCRAWPDQREVTTDELAAAIDRNAARL